MAPSPIPGCPSAVASAAASARRWRSPRWPRCFASPCRRWSFAPCATSPIRWCCAGSPWRPSTGSGSRWSGRTRALRALWRPPRGERAWRGLRRPSRLPGVRPLRLGGGRLVDEDGDAVTDDLRVHQPHWLLAGRVAEETLAAPQDDGEDHQPQLVDQVVLKKRLHELGAAVHDDVPVGPVPEARDLPRNVAGEHRGVVPRGEAAGETHRGEVLRSRASAISRTASSTEAHPSIVTVSPSRSL